MTKVLMTIFFTLSTFQWLGASEVPKEAYTFDFNVRMVQMGRMREQKVLAAVDILRRVFAYREFKQRILNYKFNGRKRFLHNKGLSNRQIYQRILSGVEQLHPYYDNAMDLEVQLYTDNKSKVLGHTFPSSNRVWINTKFFNKNPPTMIAATLVHEWLHKLGLEHEYHATKTRKNSVPYAVGYIVRDLARKVK